LASSGNPAVKTKQMTSEASTKEYP
jgi:hypothetical protein